MKFGLKSIHTLTDGSVLLECQWVN